jgi:ADP-ribose pyrophosphatase YjhB (NUDIX family)
MNIACTDELVVTTVRAVLLKYEVAQVRRQGPNFGNLMISVMVHVGIGEDKERAMRREVAQIAGATIRS